MSYSQDLGGFWDVFEKARKRRHPATGVQVYRGPRPILKVGNAEVHTLSSQLTSRSEGMPWYRSRVIRAPFRATGLSGLFSGIGKALKKVGRAVGKVAKGAVKGVGKVGKFVGKTAFKGVKFVGKTGLKVGRFAVKNVVPLALGAGGFALGKNLPGVIKAGGKLLKHRRSGGPTLPGPDQWALPPGGSTQTAPDGPMFGPSGGGATDFGPTQPGGGTPFDTASSGDEGTAVAPPSPFSNPIVLAALGVGAFMLLSGRRR